MAFYPVNLRLEGKPCVVIGGGGVAERKVLTLLEFGAKIKVVSPKITARLRDLAISRKVEHLEREYAYADLSGTFLAFAASDDPEVNHQVYEEATDRGVLINVADRPELCTFVVPSVVKRGDLVIGVSTSGSYPLLARKIRGELEDGYGTEYAEYLSLLKKIREKVIREYKDGVARREVLAKLLELDTPTLIRELGGRSFLSFLCEYEAKVSQYRKLRPLEGKVYLIGAGPGDPKLITLKGMECIREADVVIYDRLVSEELLSYAKPEAELIYVGKSSGRHSISQEEINELLVSKAREGKVVARLKGGDPCIFGRGGDEALAIAENEIPFELVPGVSSAHAVPAYAGIPVTKRGVTSTVTFVTGHEDPAKSDVDWKALADLNGTIVILMGIRNLEAITRKLIESGLPEGTPAAVIEKGSTPEQKTLVSMVGDIAEQAKESAIEPPAVIVIGEVVRLREKLSWFEEASTGVPRVKTPSRLRLS